MTSLLIIPLFIWRLSSQISFKYKRELYDEKLKDALKKARFGVEQR